MGGQLCSQLRAMMRELARYLYFSAAEWAAADFEVPVTVNWSEPGRVFRLSERGDRARVYELVLREGSADDHLRYIDGALLVDLWDELVLPRGVRAAWAPLVRQILAPADATTVA